MKQIGSTALMFIACAAGLIGCGRSEPVATAPPDTFPATTIAGKLPAWPGQAAFVTLVGAFSFEISGDPEGTTLESIELAPPLYPGTVSTNGTFEIELTAPDPATLGPLGCTNDDPDVAVIGAAVVSRVPNPTLGSDVLGIYTKGDVSVAEPQGVWIYATESYDIKVACTDPEQIGLSRVNLTLAPGWNQALGTVGADGTAQLTSGAIPETLAWSAFEDF